MRNLGFEEVCRLCGTEDKPQHNIFGYGADFLRKIQIMLVVNITERDELPHKICFRCSAKVTEYHEFRHKCLRTQKMFQDRLSQKNERKRVSDKKTARDIWEEQLKKKNLSNDEYCEQLVRQRLAAMPNFKGNVDDIEDYELPVDSPSTSVVIPPNLKFVDVKLTLQRVDDPNFRGVMKNPDGTYTVGAGGDELPDHISAVRVAGVGEIYSCNRCNNIVMQKSMVKLHKCHKMKKEVNQKNKSRRKSRSPTPVASRTVEAAEHRKASQSIPFNFSSNCMLVPIGNGAFAIKMMTENEIAKKDIVSENFGKLDKPPCDMAPEVQNSNKKGRGRPRKQTAVSVEPSPKIVETVRKQTSANSNTLQSLSFDYFPDAVTEKTNDDLRIPSSRNMGKGKHLEKTSMDKQKFYEHPLKIANYEDEVLKHLQKRSKRASKKKKLDDDFLDDSSIDLFYKTGNFSKTSATIDSVKRPDRGQKRSRTSSHRTNSSNQSDKSLQSLSFDYLPETGDFDDDDEDEPLMKMSTPKNFATNAQSANAGPYPVGLICRNVPEPFTKKKSTTESKYEILPASNTGKLILKSVPSKVQKSPEKLNEPFFTVVNLQPEENFSSFHKQSLQESQITTTQKPKRMKAAKESYTCEICSQKFSKTKALMKHVSKHFSNTL